MGSSDSETLLREREERLAFLRALAAETHSAEVDDILRIVVRRLGELLRVSRCAIAHVDPDGSFHVPHDYTDGCQSIVGAHKLTAYGAERLTATTEPIVVRDIEAEFPPEAAARNLARETRAMIVCSHVRTSGLCSLMAVQHVTPRDWTPHEVALVGETSARTWATIEQRAAEEKLRRSHGLLRVAGEAAKVGGWRVDVPAMTVTWSEQMYAIFEIPPGEKMAMTAGVDYTEPSMHARVDAAIAACMQQGTPFDMELAARTRSGRKLWVRAIGRAERDADGRITSINGAIQDITERRDLEHSLRQAQKLEAIGHLAGGIAHDFNNVLSVILPLASYVTSKMDPADPLYADLEEIVSAGQRASELTRQLLAFSRQQALQPRVVDLNDVVVRMERMLQRLVGSSVQLSLLLTEEPSWVLVDPNQMDQVIMNLVVNARDAMPGGGTIRIETARGGAEDATVVLTIRDQGLGMDPETCARVFEPFFSTKEQGRGTGLGLSTVYGIVTQSGGEIRVESAPGEGSSFHVRLPLAERPADEARSFEPKKSVVRGVETILLVENDAQVRTTVRTILQRAGYQVMEASNGGEALILCERNVGTIHLLLTDILMPLIDGKELAARLSAMRPQMSVLFMSGAASLGEAAPAADMLVKPVTAEALLSKLREVLDLSTAKSQLRAQ